MCKNTRIITKISRNTHCKISHKGKTVTAQTMRAPRTRRGTDPLNLNHIKPLHHFLTRCTLITPSSQSSTK